MASRSRRHHVIAIGLSSRRGRAEPTVGGGEIGCQPVGIRQISAGVEAHDANALGIILVVGERRTSSADDEAVGRIRGTSHGSGSVRTGILLIESPMGRYPVWTESVNTCGVQVERIDRCSRNAT